VKKRIPWDFSESTLISVWLWNTEHFEARIFAEGKNDRKAYSWKIVDKTQGLEIPFDSNMVASFAEAQTEIIEVIGKSYDPRLGYQAYAGELATTFAIADGTRFDFGPIRGASVVVKYVDKEGEERVAVGSIQIDHYDILVVQDATTALRLPPNKIRDINEEFSSISYLQQKREDQKYRPQGRKGVMRAEYKRGCTGHPGIEPGTVVHTSGDPYCPVHNV
jgi:hypothetical protein